MRSTNLTELDYLEIENTPTDKVERRDIQSRGVPIYDDNTRESNMVYSSTLSVLRSSRDAILKHAQIHFDRALQYGVLSYNNDKKTD